MDPAGIDRAAAAMAKLWANPYGWDGLDEFYRTQYRADVALILEAYFGVQVESGAL
jgi:hypothetical protein